MIRIRRKESTSKKQIKSRVDVLLMFMKMRKKALGVKVCDKNRITGTLTQQLDRFITLHTSGYSLCAWAGMLNVMWFDQEKSKSSDDTERRQERSDEEGERY